ncbi:hypothetical protein BLNAU_19423 [Blattamonas nauphoetae]|uniref:DUF4371 domain-containing protein n=1 Tax=Blattamonas nauphoetae TaxID=2049346 RepID=A0ABQ9X4P7_9EUKA|nr:hypothetical protein BLNAU_19423 [Blattamonas nauphoetae]
MMLHGAENSTREKMLSILVKTMTEEKKVTYEMLCVKEQTERGTTNGEAALKGQINGFYGRLRASCEELLHIHCGAHTTNLVFMRTMREAVVKPFDDILEVCHSFAVFIHHHRQLQRRWSETQASMKQRQTSIPFGNETRWRSKHKRTESGVDVTMRDFFTRMIVSIFEESEHPFVVAREVADIDLFDVVPRQIFIGSPFRHIGVRTRLNDRSNSLKVIQVLLV